MSNQAGKGDRPRNNASAKFWKNYDAIDWSDKWQKQKREQGLQNLARQRMERK